MQFSCKTLDGCYSRSFLLNNQSRLEGLIGVSPSYMCLPSNRLPSNSVSSAAVTNPSTFLLVFPSHALQVDSSQGDRLTFGRAWREIPEHLRDTLVQVLFIFRGFAR